MSNPLRIQAPAKLNLALAVGPVDLESGDGRHPICSWMVPVTLCDDLTLTRLEDDRFSRYAIVWADDARRTREIDWSITQDLAVRAHLLLERETGRRMPIQAKLEKRIPVGAGLGGGSSDAAAMLTGCNRLFELGIEADELERIGSILGSDVPFFVRLRSALVEGFGEQLSPAATPAQLNVVLVLPDLECSTPDVYRSFDNTVGDDDLSARFERGVQRVAQLLEGVERSPLDPDSPFNDLAGPALSMHEDLRDLTLSISDLAERPAHVTGSGSGLFVVCDNVLHAEHLARAIEERESNSVAIAVELHTPDSTADTTSGAE